MELEEWTTPGRMIQELPEDGLLFLREDLLMVFNMKDLSFDIYCIFPESGATSNGIGGFQCIQSLLLPQLDNKSSLEYILFNQSQSSIVSNPVILRSTWLTGASIQE